MKNQIKTLTGLTTSALLDKYLLMEQFLQGRYVMKRLFILLCVCILAASTAIAAEKRVLSPMLRAAAAEQEPNAAATEVKPEKGGLIDINSASLKQLKALKGVGVEYSERIVAGRPYFTLEQLVIRRIIPGDIYESIKDQLIARQTY